MGGMGDDLLEVDLGREQTAVTVVAGSYHSCAILYTGDVKCWGERGFLLCFCCVFENHSQATTVHY